jgi:hypothetical protein
MQPLLLCRCVTYAAAAESSSQQQQQQQQQQPEGHLEQLRLTERDFRGVISLLRGSMEMPEEPLEELDAQERQ